MRKRVYAVNGFRNLEKINMEIHVTDESVQIYEYEKMRRKLYRETADPWCTIEHKRGRKKGFWKLRDTVDYWVNIDGDSLKCANKTVAEAIKRDIERRFGTR